MVSALASSSFTDDLKKEDSVKLKALVKDCDLLQDTNTTSSAWSHCPPLGSVLRRGEIVPQTGQKPAIAQSCSPDSRVRLEENVSFKEHTGVLCYFYRSELDDDN